jgi:hypothetical protein
MEATLEAPVTSVETAKRKRGRPKGSVKPDSKRQQKLRERAEREARKAEEAQG